MANIGIVTTWYERGAAYVSRAYLQVLEGKHHVFIYARLGESSKGDPRWDLPNVTRAPYLAGPLYCGTSAISRLHFFRWLRNNGVELLLFNEEHDVRIVREAAAAGYVCGAYVDYYTDDTIPDFDVYDFLLCNTRRHHSVFQHHRNCLYLPWGTDPCLFRPIGPRPLRRGEVVFFHSAGTGGISLRKGTDLLVRAFQQVRGPARLIIHSQSPLSKYACVQDLIAQDPRIEFIHRTVPAPGLYHLGDVYVYPSRLEGIGLSVPEALASGLPAIVTNEPPMSEFVQDGCNGLLVDVYERKKRDDGYYWPESHVRVDHLARCMQAYVDDADLVSEHSGNARRFAVEHLDWAANAAGLADWISRLAEGRRRAAGSLCTTVRHALVDGFLVLQHVLGNSLKRVLPPGMRGRVRRLLKAA